MVHHRDHSAPAGGDLHKIAPRILILALWFFSTWFGGVFDSLLWPILGFIFAPTTLLWYSAVQH